MSVFSFISPSTAKVVKAIKKTKNKADGESKDKNSKFHKQKTPPELFCPKDVFKFGLSKI